VNLDALGRAAFGGFLADILELGRDLVDDYFGDIAVHLEYFRAKIDADLISGAEIFVYADLHCNSPFALLSSNLFFED